MRTWMTPALLALALGACGAREPAPDAASETPAPGGAAEAVASAAENLAAMPAWGDAAAAGVDYRGVGQEPGWMIDIYRDGRIVAIWDYGERIARFAQSTLERPRGGGVSRRYTLTHAGAPFIVTVFETPCEDVMSGQPYPTTIDIEIDGRRLSGCGRAL